MIWNELKSGAPGRRFVAHYECRHGRNRANTIVVMAAGALLGLLGVVMLLIPGPGVAALLVAGALLASGSRKVAQALDCCELRVRALLRRI